MKVFSKTLLTFAVAVTSTSMLQAEPTEATDLFTQGDSDRPLYRYPGLVKSKAGTLIAVAEGRKNKASGWDTVDIFMRTSKDAGKTWSDVKQITKAPADAKDNPVSLTLKKPAHAGEIATHNPTLIADQKNGGIHILYGVEYNRVFHMTADDNGEGLTEPVEITKVFEEFKSEVDWKLIAVGPGTGAQLKSGRLVVPVWLSLGKGGIGFQPAATATIYSDDNGKTWKRGEIVAFDLDITNAKTGTKIEKPLEAAVAQTADGSVVINIRNKDLKGMRIQATSKDGATGWSEAAGIKGLLEPMCQGSLVNTKAGLIFANPANMIMRMKLTARLSTDNGKTYASSQVIDSGIAGYTSLAAGEGDSVHILYERGANMSESEPEAITFRSFSSADFKK
ncbi:MAG: glycoside hydrolase [Verrucomicrobiales bacterium]|nr:glycoside hydrolase [Verrucomicrobiales bacterium]